jgi:hypothetical protein
VPEWRGSLGGREACKPAARTARLSPAELQQALDRRHHCFNATNTVSWPPTSLSATQTLDSKLASLTATWMLRSTRHRVSCGTARGRRGSKQASTNKCPTSERLETPPPPDIVIPFARDADFVERGTTLDQIHQVCAAPGSRAALFGLGGVG